MPRLPADFTRRPFEAIVIGLSAGGVEALNEILPRLPADFAIPVLVTLHLVPHAEFLPDAFRTPPGLRLKEAEDKEPLLPGIYFAPPNYHLLVEDERILSLSNEETVHFARPAIDVLFESAADVFGPKLLGVLLTGANEDGAAGLARIHERGGLTVVQNPSEARAPRMPEAAIARRAPDLVLSLKEIGSLLAGLAAPAFARNDTP